MNEIDRLKVQELLKSAKLPAGELQLGEDLWPRMLNRLQQPHVRMSPLDRALIAVAIAFCVVFPEVIPVLVCHL